VDDHAGALVRERHNEVERAYREHGERLWRALVAYTGDPEIASEARAEAFAQALARGSALRSPASWAWTAAFRIAAGELKRRGKTSRLGQEATYEMHEPADHLIKAIASLPSRQRMAIVLHDYADRPTDEVAQTLGVSRAMVHVHLSRARARLRAILEEAADA
jgi:RNA polymerase sigma-70 factor, ECF subfamily